MHHLLLEANTIFSLLDLTDVCNVSTRWVPLVGDCSCRVSLFGLSQGLALSRSIANYELYFQCNGGGGGVVIPYYINSLSNEGGGVGVCGRCTPKYRTMVILFIPSIFFYVSNKFVCELVYRSVVEYLAACY